jgi:hypothetical protein
MRLIDIPVLLLFTILALGQQQQQPSSGVNLYLLEKEAALGKALAADFRRRAPSVDDADLRAYITKVVARLNELAQSPFPITVEISGGTDLKPDTVGLPGGYLFVPIRLLASAQDESWPGQSLMRWPISRLVKPRGRLLRGRLRTWLLCRSSSLGVGRTTTIRGSRWAFGSFRTSTKLRQTGLPLSG